MHQNSDSTLKILLIRNIDKIKIVNCKLKMTHRNGEINVLKFV